MFASAKMKLSKIARVISKPLIFCSPGCMPVLRDKLFLRRRWATLLHLSALFFFLLFPSTFGQPHGSPTTPISTSWAALAFLLLSFRQFAVRLIRREQALVSLINWHIVQSVLLSVTIFMVFAGVITAWALQWSTSDISVLVSVMGSVLLAVSLDGKWQFGYYTEYAISRAIARCDRFRVGSRVDEESKTHKEIYLRTLYDRENCEKEVLGQWGGDVREVKGYSSDEKLTTAGGSSDGEDLENQSLPLQRHNQHKQDSNGFKEKRAWKYVVKDWGFEHRTAAGYWSNVPPLAKPGDALHWRVIHARLLLAWLPEHVDKEGFLRVLIENARQLENVCAALQTWKGADALGRTVQNIDELVLRDLEGFVGIVILEYPQAIWSILNFVTCGWKTMDKEDLLDGKTMTLEFIRALLGLSQGGWEESGLELRSDPHCLPEEGDMRPKIDDNKEGDTCDDYTNRVELETGKGASELNATAELYDKPSDGDEKSSLTGSVTSRNAKRYGAL